MQTSLKCQKHQNIKNKKTKQGDGNAVYPQIKTLKHLNFSNYFFDRVGPALGTARFCTDITKKRTKNNNTKQQKQNINKKQKTKKQQTNKKQKNKQTNKKTKKNKKTNKKNKKNKKKQKKPRGPYRKLRRNQ